MRFPMAWATVARDNVALKWGVVALSCVSLVLAIALAGAASKAPLLIDRGCVSEAVEGKPVGNIQSADELKAFVTEALHQRFDSAAVASPAYLSFEELTARSKEDAELNSRKMRQRVLVNELARDGDKVSVQADRLISVGEVRSAFAFPLIVTLGSVPRSVSNPYGLVVLRAEPVKLEGGEK